MVSRSLKSNFATKGHPIHFWNVALRPRIAVFLRSLSSSSGFAVVESVRSAEADRHGYDAPTAGAPTA